PLVPIKLDRVKGIGGYMNRTQRPQLLTQISQEAAIRLADRMMDGSLGDVARIMTKKVLWALFAACFSAALVVGHATASNGQTNNKTFEYTVGLWGDLPYSDLQATTGVPNLIADMNNSDIDFSVHDGDLKAGNGTPGSTTPTTCSNALYTQALGYFNS